MADDEELGTVGIKPTAVKDVDSGEIDRLIYSIPNSTLDFDVQPAVWLTDYLLTIVGLSLVVHLIVEAPAVNFPTIALVVYYIGFALTWLVGGMAHHFSYIAVQTKLRTGDDAVVMERKLDRLNKRILFVWKTAAAANIVPVSAAFVVFFWLSFAKETAEIASIVTVTLGGVLCVVLLVVDGMDFKYFIPLSVIALICFGVGCGIVQVYEGVGYAVFSIVVAVQQQMRWRISEKYFNHNAVFHTIILLAGYPLLHISALQIVRIDF